MIRRSRTTAILLLGAILLVVHGLVVPVIYTFAAGESADATIVECHSTTKNGNACTGRWTLPDGTTETGTVSGDLYRSDVGSTVPIRTSALGTYTDELQANLWYRAIWPLLIDAALVALWIWRRSLIGRGSEAAQRLRADRSVNAKLLAVDNSGVTDLDGTRYFTVKDIDATTTVLSDGLGNPVWTLTGEALSGALRRVTIRDQQGRELGLVVTGSRQLVLQIPSDAPE
ncbi:MAG: hypothetical protein ACRD0P_40520, partial [Stackebrandtia sp.]